MGQAYRHTGIHCRSVLPIVNSINAMRWLYDKRAAEVYSRSKQHERNEEVVI